MKFSAILFSLFLLFSCDEVEKEEVYVGDTIILLEKPYDLKSEIEKSLVVPYDYSDTLFYRPIFICGLGRVREPRIYSLFVDTLPAVELIKNKYNGILLDMSDNESFLLYLESSGLTVEQFLQSKMTFSFSIETISKDSVLTVETYEHGNKVYDIVKFFTFKNGKWTYRVSPTFDK